ncbi:hypothetical protein FOH10_31560 [Nocardia otitidiscaviarum]|uniref:Uncharacterized protein n=1 Tax=Nocardia otitidiscaviarum TaxID=1823 RepID=A0A516NUK7_9NOCA|nr:hypothetical protein [Nocardia otitidiscaviarum]MCP9621990.1 hypothetical protein [Nocardia otitidiscaviarum]QDP82588.1 hypothetical protein FOH10_31560 [Nocardia otitidiscaviarum]
MSVRFLNVDVEVRDSADLTSLGAALEALGRDVSLLYCGEIEPGRWMLSFEAYLDTMDDPDAVAEACCAAIEHLPPAARARWNEAEDRVFDLGFDAAVDGHVGQPVLSPATLARLAAIDARIAISVYTHDLVSRETSTDAELIAPDSD